MAEGGERVMVVAQRDLDPTTFDPTGDLLGLVTDLTLLAMVGIVDPPRAEAKAAIAECRGAGIRVRMITGDHATTAAAIAGELGIEGRAITGAEFAAMSDEELLTQLPGIGVVARVAPEDKLRLVRLLKQSGNVAAMTGDGVNDAPALKAADIGVAMGITGTEVSKEAAVMILTDDNFATIVNAVSYGRTLYDNLLKYLRFQMSTLVAYIAVFLISGALNIASDGQGGMTVLDATMQLAAAEKSPYRSYRVATPGVGRDVSVLARDPRASAQVWSRQGGYPGDGAYLEFHKIRWPGGLKYWRVTGSGVDLGAKEPYDPANASRHAESHAAHFVRLIDRVAAEETKRGSVLAAPFDTELFGHWWFEGPHFLESAYRLLPDFRDITPRTARAHLDASPPGPALRLPAGSWGANGDFSMWLSQLTAWTWERLWPLEESFWDVAAQVLHTPAARTALAQATRELLLAQSSDWQFIISTGAVTDYAFERFNGHCEAAEKIVAALRPGPGQDLPLAHRLAEQYHAKDDPFPDPLPAVEAALSGSRSLTLG